MRKLYISLTHRCSKKISSCQSRRCNCYRKILKRYERYIDYEIATFGIDNVVDCKDKIINKAKQIIEKERQKQKFNKEHNLTVITNNKKKNPDNDKLDE